MTVEELTRGVQFTVDQRGQVTAVVIEPSLWERILVALVPDQGAPSVRTQHTGRSVTPNTRPDRALEDAEDRTLVQSLHDRLASGPAAARALRWQDVAGQWQ